MKLRIIELAAMGMDALKAMALKGQLHGPSMWMAFRGAGTYIKAVAKGDIASDSDQAGRADICRLCQHCTPRPVEVGGRTVTSFYCGTPAWYADAWDNEKTCGCLVGISVDREPLQHAAGKAVVESERCPLGKW